MARVNSGAPGPPGECGMCWRRRGFQGFVGGGGITKVCKNVLMGDEEMYQASGEQVHVLCTSVRFPFRGPPATEKIPFVSEKIRKGNVLSPLRPHPNKIINKK